MSFSTLLGRLLAPARLPIHLLCLLWSLTTPTTWAQPQSNNTVELTAGTDKITIGPHLRLLEDKSNALTLDDVMAMGDQFVDNKDLIPNFNVSTSTYWVSVSVALTGSSDAAERQHWILDYEEPMFQEVDIYLRHPDGRIEHHALGSLRPYSDKPLRARTHAVVLPLETGKPLEIWIRTKTDYVHFIPLSIWRSDAFYNYQQGLSIFHGLYFGITLAMIVYNLFAWWTLRERTYVFYVIAMLLTASVQLALTGVLGCYFIPDSPQLTNFIFIGSYNIGMIFILLFCRDFLGQITLMEKACNLLLATFSVLTAMWLMQLQVLWSIVFPPTIMITSIIIMSISTRQAMRGDKAAMYFSVGYGWFLIGSLVFSLTVMNVIPFNPVTFAAVEIGSGFVAILLSLALAQRMRQIKDEKDLAQQESIQHKQLALDTVERYSRQLEEDVRTRTAELVATQQKLIVTEKMAALGVFTAGMAHEINNPANFVAAGAQNAEAQLGQLEGFVGDLLDEEADPDIRDTFGQHFRKLGESLSVIRTGISRIDNVVKHLRATHPEGDVGMQPANVVDTLEAAWKVLSPTIKIPMTLRTDFPYRPSIPCRVAEIHQVFLALLGNAVHAIEDAAISKGDGYQGEIRLQSRQQADQLVITIEDNGIGIAADKMDKIFDPFFTTKVVGRGAGLGLSMARDVVDKHGGTLSVDAAEGNGARFHLTLPVTHTA